ncbi:hypothetical protein [Calidithermus roseus]|uniref:hypothetical protein n=1 Tax=Calidithermus roseus TaxID=1644118 RepID=UPI0011C4A52A|nr:hypothetical protein [Calidithermus roseus]
MRMTDPSGYGCLYRFKACGRWWLVKFLPPFDGMVSLTDSRGRVRVLSSLEEAGALIALLPKSTDALTVTAENPPLTAQTSVSVRTDTALTLEEEGGVLVI